MIFRSLAIVGALIGFSSDPLHAADASPASVPFQVVEILPIGFDENGLSGPGGARLQTELPATEIVAIGEDHGFAGSPELGRALAHDMAAIADGAPLFHAVEVGPWSVKWAEARLVEGGIDALDKALDRRPFAMPFLTNIDDVALAMPFAASGRLWGIDQEFVGAPTILLDELAARTTDPAIRQRLAAWRDKDSAALAEGRFGDIMLSTASEAEFAALRSAFAGDADAQLRVDALADSSAIYRLNDSGRYLENNEARSGLMQRYFLDAWRAAGTPAPRVLLKLGANHAGRGTTPTSIVDLGSLLPGLAAANGKKSLHIAYLPLAGTVRTIKPAVSRFTDVAPYRDEIVGPFLDAAGIARDSLPPTGHVLIPLAALRHKLAGKPLRDLPDYARFLLLGFDYLVTTRDAQAATHFEAR